MQKLERGRISSINMENISWLAETFSKKPDEYVPWLVECGSVSELSKTMFFLVLLQSFVMPKTGILFQPFPFFTSKEIIVTISSQP